MPNLVARQFPRLLALTWLVALSACDYLGWTGSVSGESEETSVFESRIGKPGWFHSVTAPTLNTREEVDRLWRAKKRCCVPEPQLQANNREFYRACYDAIIAHLENDELVVRCLWLMDTGMTTEQAYAIKKFLVDHYFEHRSPTADCVNCAPADTVARVSRELAHQEMYGDNLEIAIALIERVLDERGPEISPWVQVELYESLGRMYLRTGATPEAKTRMENADLSFRGQLEGDKGVAARYPKFELVHREIMGQ